MGRWGALAARTGGDDGERHAETDEDCNTESEGHAGASEDNHAEASEENHAGEDEGTPDETDGGSYADEERPPSLEEFLEANHRLFTVIGIFGALSVYLMKFEARVGDSGAGVAGSGLSGGPVGAVLLLFLVTSALAVRNSYRCTERAREHGAYLLVFGYAVFMYSFVTLTVSVVFVIWGRYAQGAESVLGSSFVYALVFVYVPFVFRADALRSFDGATPLSVGIRRAPYLGAGLLAAWHAMQWERDALPPVLLDSAAATIGTVLGLVGNHLVITAAVVAVLWMVDRSIGWIRNDVVRPGDG